MTVNDTGFIPLWDAVHGPAHEPHPRSSERWQFVLCAILEGRLGVMVPVSPFSRAWDEQLRQILDGLESGQHAVRFARPLHAIRVRQNEIGALLRQFRARRGPRRGQTRSAWEDIGYCEKAHALVLLDKIKPWRALKYVSDDGRRLAGANTDEISKLKRASLLYNRLFRGRESF